MLSPELRSWVLLPLRLSGTVCCRIRQRFCSLIARTLTTRFPEKIVALVATEEAKMQLVFAKGKQSTSPLNMNEQLKHFLSLINGRGGGNPQFAQGGGDLSISAETMRQQIKEQFVTE